MYFRNRSLRYESLETRDLLAAVEMVDTIAADSAGTVTVPVEIGDTIGMRAAEIRIAYDPATLDVDPDEITAGSVWRDHGAVMARVDEEIGEIVIFAFAAEGLTVNAGSLVDIKFNLRKDACIDTARIDLTEIRVDDGELTLSVDPVAGIDGTDGVIAIDEQSSQTSDSTLVVSRVPRVMITQRPTSPDVNFPARVPFPSLLSHDSTIAYKAADSSRDDVTDFILATTDGW